MCFIDSCLDKTELQLCVNIHILENLKKKSHNKASGEKVVLVQTTETSLGLHLYKAVLRYDCIGGIEQSDRNTIEQKVMHWNRCSCLLMRSVGTL